MRVQFEPGVKQISVLAPEEALRILPLPKVEHAPNGVASEEVHTIDWVIAEEIMP